MRTTPIWSRLTAQEGGGRPTFPPFDVSCRRKADAQTSPMRTSYALVTEPEQPLLVGWPQRRRITVIRIQYISSRQTLAAAKCAAALLKIA